MGIAAGEMSKTISVVTTDDAAVESVESMTLTLSGPSANTKITAAVGTDTINDNDFITRAIRRLIWSFGA